ncbi:cytochrome P450 [Streptomyces sp. NBC_00005]|uniref:cytochrome P450 n=1 Tax=Streptomyces sp. NBC_00005 TaxID=2903609 RepID=UPI003252B4C5
MTDTHISSAFDVFARIAEPEARRDPYPFLRELREKEPVHRTAAGFWLVSSHTDAQAVLAGADRLFASPDRERLEQQFPPAVEHSSTAVLMESLPLRNPPEHTRLRRLVAREFTPRRVDTLRARMAEICDRLLDAVEEPLRDGETVDLHAALSEPFTLQVFAELLGVPESDRGWLAETVLDIVAGVTDVSRELLARADARTDELATYFTELAAARRSDPRGDLVSALVRTHDEDPDRLDERELFGMLWILWIVGFEGTAAALDHAVRALFAHPGTGHWLRQGQPEALAFAEEVLRWSGPELISSVPRIAAEDVVLSGTPIPAGSDVRVVIAAANRDPAAFPDPDRFDPARDNSTHLAFGHGIHHCLGAFLVRAELSTALPRLHTRFPELSEGGEPGWRQARVMRMPTDLPVRLEARG